MVRAFISADFNNKQMLEKVSSIQQKINQTGAHLRSVNLDILHITLEFLGDISRDQIETVKRILDTLDFQSFRLLVKNPNVLPNENYVRVVYCVLNGDVEPLKVTQKELRSKLRDDGFKVDKRPFKPHLTIARVKSSRNRKELISAIQELSEMDCGVQEITSIKLKKSDLTSEGPKYTTLHEVHAK